MSYLLNPYVRNPQISVVGAYNGGGLIVNGATWTTTTTFSGHNVGDLLVAVGAVRGTDSGTTNAGWTRVCSFIASAQRFGYVYYRFANTTSNITFELSGGTSASAIQYSSGITFKDAASIGNFAVIDTTTTGTSVPVPAISPLQKTNGTSAVISCTYAGVVTAATNMIVASGAGGGTMMAYALNKSSFTGETLTVNSSNYLNSASVEIVSI